MKENYYIASCVFTAWHPNLSKKIQEYVKNRFDIKPVRCCMPDFKVNEYAEKMPEDYRDEWCALSNTLDFKNAERVFTICHNCTNLICDTYPEINVTSLWELILSDEDFVYPDYGHQTMYLQDCWRAAESLGEQLAVRKLLEKMNIDIIELPDNFEKTRFCGRSFYKLKYIRESRRAPKNHPLNTNPEAPIPSDDEQISMMRSYCKDFADTPVVCYCHYCLEGISKGGAKGYHLAELLFKGNFQSNNGFDYFT